MKKISKKNLILPAAVLLGVAFFAVPRIFQSGGLIPFAGQKAKTYYCPMHPAYVSDRPGDCPICNMKLVPKESAKSGKRKILYYRHPMGQPDTSSVPKKDSMGMDYIPVYEDGMSEQAGRVSGHAVIDILPARQQLVGVKIGEARRRPLAKEIRTVGRVVYDPALYTAQQEFISAVGTWKKAEGGGSSYHEPRERAEALLEASRIRLRLLGMSEAEVKELEKTKTQDRDLILPKEISRLPMSIAGPSAWVYATIYESDLPFVKIGTHAVLAASAFSGKKFEGEVRALDPLLDPMTRAIRVRIRTENPEEFLRPEMYVDVVLKTDLGELISVPEEAVMFTGERTIVFILHGEGTFEPREVEVGAKAGKFYEIKTGVQPRERVVVSGNFLIDSESRLQGAFAGMMPPADSDAKPVAHPEMKMESGGGHSHGG